MDYKVNVLNKDNGNVELFTGSDVNDLLQKASNYSLIIKVGNLYNSDSEKRKKLLELKKNFANLYTKQFSEDFENKKKILENHGKNKNEFWQRINSKIPKVFNEKPPFLEELPIEPQYTPINPKPEKTELKYKANKTIIDIISKSRYHNKLHLIEEQFKRDCELWKNNKLKIEIINSELRNTFLNHKSKIEIINNERMNEWGERKKQFEENLNKFNSFIIHSFSNEKEEIEEYYLDLLQLIMPPLDFWDKVVSVNFNDSNKILYVEYLLPSFNDLNNIKEIKYIQAKDIFTEVPMSQKDYEKYYDEIIYQIAIYLLYVVCINDENDYLEAVAINGYVQSIDKASGANIKPCIISLFVKEVDVMSLNLDNIDARICFKKLKGVSASVLASQTAIAPILQFDKNDKRFIQSKEVFNTLNDSMNLAAMDWEDFEHLIREIFEKEFQSNGGEVKVTQASRDGGVDAIAFDPDPIRGGKIVIQAKRYTNTVGVSAVRDLYGTVLNEGATKGILVSTADYGPDAYEFAKGKPLTLLNGSNLLYLLEKHGHHAKIDLREAKKILGEKEK